MFFSYEESTLISILNSGIHANPLSIDTNRINWQNLYDLSLNHQLAAMVGHVLKENNVSNPFEENFLSDFHQGLLLNAQQQKTIAQLTQLFNQSNISHCFLKGNFVKDTYPYAVYRWMSDIDVLVSPKDRQLLNHVLTKNMQYKEIYYKVNNHDVYISLEGVVLEVHVHLFNVQYKALSNSFMLIEQELLKGENLLFNQYAFFIAHHLKHYALSSGTGVRSVLDFYLVYKKYCNLIDSTALYKLLKEWNLEASYHALLEISQKWFNPDYSQNLSLKEESLLLKSHVFGNFNMLVHNQLHQKGNAANFLKSRIFLPLDQMQAQYPSLVNHNHLLPLYWIKRIWAGIFNKPKAILKELSVLLQHLKK